MSALFPFISNAALGMTMLALIVVVMLPSIKAKREEAFQEEA